MPFDIDEQEKRAEFLKLMAEVAYLAIAVNEFTEYCVFYEFSGHVGHVRIEIARSKEAYSDTIASTEFYAKYQDAERPYKVAENAFILAKRDHLKSILDDGEIAYDAMTPVETLVRTYDF